MFLTINPPPQRMDSADSVNACPSGVLTGSLPTLEAGTKPSLWRHQIGSFRSSSNAATASWKTCETPSPLQTLPVAPTAGGGGEGLAPSRQPDMVLTVGCPCGQHAGQSEGQCSEEGMEATRKLISSWPSKKTGFGPHLSSATALLTSSSL